MPVTYSGTGSSRRWRWRSSSCARSWMCSTRGCSSRSRSAARPRMRPKRERLNQAKLPKLRLPQRPTAARAPAHRAHRAKLQLLRRPHRLARKARWCSPIHRHSVLRGTDYRSHTAVTERTVVLTVTCGPTVYSCVHTPQQRRTTVVVSDAALLRRRPQALRCASASGYVTTGTARLDCVDSRCTTGLTHLRRCSL